jgi:hypothetical protein
MYYDYVKYIKNNTLHFTLTTAYGMREFADAVVMETDTLYYSGIIFAIVGVCVVCCILVV